MRIARAASIAVVPAFSFAVAASPAPAAPQGPWVQPAVELSVADGDAAERQIAIVPDGTATAVWQRDNGSNTIIQSATRPPGGSFADAVNLSVIGKNSYEPQIAVDPKGTAIVVWYHSNGSNNIIQSISTIQPSFLLGTVKTGTGSGTVSSMPAEINCGADCAENYLSFTKVTLTATPDSGSSFQGWGERARARPATPAS